MDREQSVDRLAGRARTISGRVARSILVVAALSSLGACAETTSPVARPPATLPATLPSTPVGPAGLAIPARPEGAGLSILFIGNSHVRGLPDRVRAMIEQRSGDLAVHAEAATRSGFLADHWDDEGSQASLRGRAWTHVVLQGQQYSQSGRFDYPTTAAESWIRTAKAQGTIPVLFPEHPQRDRDTEARRVHDLHADIARAEPACVAPVGLVWDEVIAEGLGPDLHAADGNHAAPPGSFLTALVLFEVITSTPATTLSAQSEVDITGSRQAVMRRIVHEVVTDHPPCEYR